MGCSSSSGFPSASSMAQLSMNNALVWQEIGAIQQAILLASSQCTPTGSQMYTTIAGTTPMTFISGILAVTVTSPGSGYVQDVPNVTFTPPNGSSASGAAATVVTNGGAITAINVTSGGAGYQPIPATLGISTLAGAGANLQPLVDATGAIISVNIISGGANYTINDSVFATRAVPANPLYVEAMFQITAVSVTGQIIAVTVTNSGSGYQDSVTTVNIMSTLSSTAAYPYGTGFLGTVVTDATGVITQVTVNNVGSGYINYPPYLTINDVGTGAVTVVTLSGTGVSSIAVTNTGIVYNPSTAPLPNPPANPATVTLTVNVNTFGTDPTLYWQVWSGATTNPVVSAELNAITTYFTSLGYNIQIQSNPNVNNTIQWYISWSN